MMKKRGIMILLSLSLVFSSCPNMLENPRPKTGKGSFSLSLKSGGRTIMPSSSQTFAVYRLSFTPVNNQGASPVTADRTEETISEAVELSPGNWNLLVIAYKDAEMTMPKAEGALQDILIADRPVSRELTLYPILGGEGTFRWRISFPSVDTATMTIAPKDASMGPPIIVDPLNGAVPNSAEPISLNAGYYDITITLTKEGSREFIWKETLHVYQNLESYYENDFTENDLNGEPQPWTPWARIISNVPGNGLFEGTAADSDGYVYAVGVQIGVETYNYGNDVTAAGGSAGNNAVIVKYNPEGKALWAITPTGGGDTRFSGVAIDSSRNIIVSGEIRGLGTVQFGGFSLAGTTSSINETIGGRSRILVKYDPAGNVLWAKGVESITAGVDGGDAAVYPPRLDSQGNIYVPGYQRGTVDYGASAEPITVQGRKPVLVKYASNGDPLWAKTIGAAQSMDADFINAAVDSEGNCYVAGYMGAGTILVGDVTLTGISSPNPNAIIVKYDPDGDVEWAKSVSSEVAGNSQFNGIGVYGNTVYAAGFIVGSGNYVFGSITVTGKPAASTQVIVAYNAADGTVQKAVSGELGRVWSLMADNSEVYAAGYTGNTTIYDASLVMYNQNLDPLPPPYIKAAVGEKNSVFLRGCFMDHTYLYLAGYQIGTTDLSGFGLGTIQGSAVDPNRNPLLIKIRKF